MGGAGAAAAAPRDAEHTAHYSSGEVSASFTSTHMTVRTKNTAAAIDDEIVKYRKIKSKGYVGLPPRFIHYMSLLPDCCIVWRTQ